MISAQLEKVQSGTGPAFFDSISIDFCDGLNDLFGLLHVASFPNSRRTCATVLLFADGEVATRRQTDLAARLDGWDEVELDGLRVSTDAPLERWTVAVSGPDGSVELAAAAVSLPVDLTGTPPADVLTRASGISQYEQVLELRGAVELDGREISVDCTGRRTHSWGCYDWSKVESWRSLYAAGRDEAVSVTAALPAGSAGHGQEVRVAHLLEGRAEPLEFDDARLSTVYDGAGLPSKASLELHAAEEEFPRRVAGETICGTWLEREREKVSVSFFRWSIEGTPALGRYETVARK
jgi:hypothetical protein